MKVVNVYLLILIKMIGISYDIGFFLIGGVYYMYVKIIYCMFICFY